MKDFGLALKQFIEALFTSRYTKHLENELTEWKDRCKSVESECSSLRVRLELQALEKAQPVPASQPVIQYVSRELKPIDQRSSWEVYEQQMIDAQEAEASQVAQPEK